MKIRNIFKNTFYQIILFYIIAIVVVACLYNLINDSIHTENKAIAAKQIAETEESIISQMELIDGIYSTLVKSSMNSLIRNAGKPLLGDEISVKNNIVPQLFLAGEPINDNQSLVDSIASDIGGTATIFVKSSEGKFVRVSTNVKKQDGSRAIGTVLEPNGHVEKNILEKNAYYGIVDILGKPYFTGYEPMLDDSGDVIGIWYVGFLIDEIEEMGKSIEGKKIFKNDLYLILDSKERIIAQSNFNSDEEIESYMRLAESDSGWEMKEELYTKWNYKLVSIYKLSDIDDIAGSESLKQLLNIGIVFGLFSLFIYYFLYKTTKTNRQLSIAVEKQKEKEVELIKARLIAEEASDSQSRFVANMSHEIRTPLNAILGYVEILKEYNQDVKLEHYLDAIDSSGNVLLDIVTDILDFAKIKAGKYTASYMPCNIGDFLEEIEILFWQKINDKDLDFELIYDIDQPTFSLPVSIIRQIAINIVGNAIKFTNAGSIIIKAVCIENNGKYNIDIIVADTGIGIAHDKKAFIFKEFEQADESHAKVGTGLGLAISNKFAEIIGGSIEVESEIGEGSIFTLKLRDINTVDCDMESTYDRNEEIDFQFLSQKAMIVDDIKNNREVIKAHCDKLNLTTKTYESGKKALKNIEIFNPDIILTDLRMPEVNGEEFAKYVRNQRPNIPIICITASINPREKYDLKDFNDIIGKPISSSRLAKTMAKYLKTEKENENTKTVNMFGHVNLTSDEFSEFLSRCYLDCKTQKIGMNPKKIKTLSEKIIAFGKEIENDNLVKIGEDLIVSGERVDIAKIIEILDDMIEYLEKE